jgi:hypothetical protein
LCEDKDREFNLLVESVKGEVVVGVDEFQTKKIPELEKLSPEEIKVLHASFQLKKFTQEDMIKKGLPLDIKKPLNSLVKKDYIKKQKDNYVISEDYILSQLSKHSSFTKIEFLKVNYSVKKEPKITVDKLKEKLSKFTDVKDQRECFILKHEILYS